MDQKYSLKFLFLYILSVSVFAFLQIGCSVTPKMAGWEPRTILVRNNSNAHIQQVALYEIVSRGSSSRRFGSFSPVPIGSEQGVTRPANAPPLPPHVGMEWIENNGMSYQKKINFKTLFTVTENRYRQTMVIQILPHGNISILFE